MDNYTGREIAIFTDIHGLLQPTLAILEDIKKRKITEIYSLGDNIGEGPNPSEVLDMLGEYNVKIINGNSEEYSILGPMPFKSYFHGSRIEQQNWTDSQLTSTQLKNLKNNKHSYDLIVGGKLIGLCHFANDVRIDFDERSTWSYQQSINYHFPYSNPQEQFQYTNSDEQKKEIKINSKKKDPFYRGFKSANEDPLFQGKTIEKYDEIIQGHVHFKLLTEDEKTKIRTLRGAAIAYGINDPIDFASYIIIKEKKIGYDVEEILVPYNRELMMKAILKSSMPDNYSILKFTSKSR